MKRALLAFVVVFVVGCGGGTDETTPPTETSEARVYFLRDGKVWPALREVRGGRDTISDTLGELLDGPTEQERAELGLTTAMPKQGLGLVLVRPPGGAAGVSNLDVKGTLLDSALAQVIFTLTQFPTVTAVEVDGRNLTRADFEDLTPAILVESPLPFKEVSSPLYATGTANTFEANFSYELTDTDGLIIAEDFVTATSGTGTRGTFELTVPFTIKFDGVGSLIVFEPSAKDGSRTNLVEIPIRMTQ